MFKEAYHEPPIHGIRKHWTIKLISLDHICDMTNTILKVHHKLLHRFGSGGAMSGYLRHPRVDRGYSHTDGETVGGDGGASAGAPAVR